MASVMRFSLLLSVYYKEKPDYLHRALLSIWDEQIVQPSEIILVEDGKLTPELNAVILEWKEKLGECFKSVRLECNRGLGDALNEGLRKCSYELVARMDTDDIALPHRFEKQLKVMEDQHVDICSSWVSEFELSEDNIVSYRKLPENHHQLVKFSKKRNPLNHPVVMYKKTIVQNAGGYKDMPWFEDYYLWVRMIQQGAILYNIQEPLVSMRVGYEQLERRGGFKYAMSEIALQKEFLKLGFINIFEFIRNISIRFTSRVVPKYLLKKIYSKIRT